MEFPEQAFVSIAPGATVAVYARALLRAVPAVWSATQSAPSNAPARRDAHALTELVALIALRALRGADLFVADADTELVEPAKAAVNAMGRWVHRSSGLPDRDRRAWRAAAEATNGILRLVREPAHQYFAAIADEGIFDACEALRALDDSSEHRSSHVTNAIRALTADLRLVQGSTHGMGFAHQLMAQPLWLDARPTTQQWKRALAMVRSERDAATATPPGWQRTIGPAELGPKLPRRQPVQLRRVVRWLEGLARWYEKRTPLETPLEEQPNRPATPSRPQRRARVRTGVDPESADVLAALREPLDLEAERKRRQEQRERLKAEAKHAREVATRQRELEKLRKELEELIHSGRKKRAKAPIGFEHTLASQGAEVLGASGVGGRRGPGRRRAPKPAAGFGVGKAKAKAETKAKADAQPKAKASKRKAPRRTKVKKRGPGARDPHGAQRASRERLDLGADIQAAAAGEAMPELAQREPRALDSMRFPDHEPEELAPPAGRTGGHVTTGFLAPDSPLAFVSERTRLAPDAPYWFGVQIGELVQGVSVGSAAQIDVRQLPARAKLDVVLFAFDGELALAADGSIGTLELDEDGMGQVVRQPTEGSSSTARGLTELRVSAAWQGRLYFPIRTSERVGPQRLRCNFYHQQTLLLSRVVTARVDAAPRSRARAAISHVDDYRLARVFDAASLGAFREHDLCLLLNDGGDGSHQLRIFGKRDVRQDVTLSGAQLESLVGETRAALRVSAWANKDEWDPNQPRDYRYGGGQTLAMLAEDLATLARAGRRAYDVLYRASGGRRRPQADRLEELLATPAHVQFASRTNPEELVPLAVLYDRPLDPNVELELCSGFRATLDLAGGVDSAKLESSPCWQRACPSLGRNDTVCPSGFWGFRHNLGIPITLADGGAESAASDLGCRGDVNLTVAVALDPGFRLREQHVRDLQAKWPALHLAEARQSALDALGAGTSHIVYFYCHGDRVGPRREIPALLVGPNSSPRIDASIISQLPPWSDPRALVFLNGCRTTALLPSQSFDLVSAFVQDANAAGVIGTEITIFEELATRFGLAFLRGFLADGLDLGVAIRRARLALLAERNPLGLAYVPFASSRLRLRP